MKIIVCVKSVPDTEIKVRLDANGKAIDLSEVEFIVSPYDEIAVEKAIQIKEQKDGTEVVVLCLGSSTAEKNIRQCLAMGADRAVLIEAENVMRDPFVTAKALSEVITEEKADLVLFGLKAADDDFGQVGPMVAGILDYDFIPAVSSMELEGDKIKIENELEGAKEVWEAETPLVLSAQKSLAEPRICSLMSIRKAKKKELKKISKDLAPANFEIVKMELPPERKAGKILGEGVEVVPELVKLLREEAKVL